MNFNNQHRFSLNILIAKIKGFGGKSRNVDKLIFFEQTLGMSTLSYI